MDGASADKVFSVVRFGHPNISGLVIGISPLRRVPQKAEFLHRICPLVDLFIVITADFP